MNKDIGMLHACQPATRPLDVHTRGAREASSATAKTPLGYQFDPVPQELFDAIDADQTLPAPSRDLPLAERRKILNGRLRPLDASVMRVMLRFRKRTRASCWVAKDTIARRIRKTPKTVQMSWRRLALRGFIEQVPVAVPDPDEPANKTGWRITLLFVPGAQGQGRGPDRRPWEERRIWSRTDRGGEETGFLPLLDSEQCAGPPISSVEEQRVSSNEGRPVSPKQRAGASNPDGSDPDGETPPSSSSPRAGRSRPDRAAVGQDDDDSCASAQGEQQEALAAVEELFSADVRAQARADIGPALNGNWRYLHAAAAMAKYNGRPIPKPLVWLKTVVRQFIARGISAEAESNLRRWADEKRANSAKRAEQARAAAVREATSAEASRETKDDLAELARMAECSNLPPRFRRMVEAKLDQPDKAPADAAPEQHGSANAESVETSAGERGMNSADDRSAGPLAGPADQARGQSAAARSPVSKPIWAGSSPSAAPPAPAFEQPPGPMLAAIEPVPSRSASRAETLAQPAETIPLTPGQTLWVSTLTADERAALDSLPARARQCLLDWYRDGPNLDPIIRAEAAKILALRIAASPPTNSPSAEDPPLTEEP